MLADIFLHSRFAEEEIERERTVILQEISQVEDTPDDYVHDLFNLAFWPGHPLSRPVAGTAATVRALQRARLPALPRGALPARPRILSRGRATSRHDDAGRRSSSARSAARAARRPPIRRQPAGRRTRALRAREGRSSRCTSASARPGIAQDDPDRYAAHVLNPALGGGMSSRLFQEMRERRGKAYTVYSFLPCFRDAGYLGVYVGTSPEWVARGRSTSSRPSCARSRREGLGADELARAKTQIKGSMLLGLETSDSRMSRIARNEIYFGRDVPLEEVAARRRRGHATTTSCAWRSGCSGPASLAVTVLGDLKGERLDDGMLRA